MGAGVVALPLGLLSGKYGGAVGVTLPEVGADSKGERSSMPSAAMTTAARRRRGGRRGRERERLGAHTHTRSHNVPVSQASGRSGEGRGPRSEAEEEEEGETGGGRGRALPGSPPKVQLNQWKLLREGEKLTSARPVLLAFRAIPAKVVGREGACIISSP